MELFETNQPQMRICVQCLREKPLDSFPKSRRCYGGRRPTCTECANESRMEYRRRHADVVKRQKHEHYLRHYTAVKDHANSYRQSNLDRVRAQQRLYNSDPVNQERRRDLARKKRYGIGTIDYNEMYILQNGRCAICGVHQSDLTKILHVDHNHQTGKIRKLLCSGCNMVLGAVKEDVNVLERMIDYIQSDGEMGDG